MATSQLWRCRAALVHDLQECSACASWQQANLAQGLPPKPALVAVEAVDRLLRKQRQQSAESWQQLVDKVEQVGFLGQPEAGRRKLPALAQPCLQPAPA